MPKRNVILAIAVVVAALVVLWSTRNPPPSPGQVDAGPLRPVQQAYRLIRDHYYQPVEDDRLCRGAVEGMVQALDPFCAYIPPERAEALERRVIAGLGRGLGMVVEIGQNRVLVAEVLAGSPAHRAGIFAGMELLAVDDKELRGLGIQAVEGLLQGPLGRQVTLKLLGDSGKAVSRSLRQGEFPLETVEGLYRDEHGRWVYAVSPELGIDYLRIKEFVKDTDEQLREGLRQIGGARALVLDLRDNPGGSLEAAVAACEMFLKEGLIVTTVGRGGGPFRHMAHREGAYPATPMAVLINGQTASAAEIVCGALRLHGRAVLVGTRSRGKGCVQSILPLGREQGKISLTTAEFYLGRYGCITHRPGSDRWGIDPHVQVVVLPSGQQRLLQLRRKACAIRPPAEENKTGPHAKAPDLAREFLQADPQLAQAVELLSRPEEMQAILKSAAGQDGQREPFEPEGG